MTANEIIARLGATKNGSGHKAKCPAHNDQKASLSINPGQDGRTLLKCHAGCTLEAICNACGLTPADLFPSNGKNGSNGKHHPIGVGEMAAHKKLPISFLREVIGLRDLADGGIGIPYRTMDGQQVLLKRRTALAAKDGSFWPKGMPLMPYGLERLSDARELGYLVIVEGESDCWTLWSHGMPALGIPGASTTRVLERDQVAGIGTVYVMREPDKGGDTFAVGVPKRLGELGFLGKVFELVLEGAKDPSDLHQQDPAAFKAKFEKALKEAKPIGATRPESFTTPIGEFLGDEEEADQPEDFLTDLLLPVGVPAFLAGEPKTSKTYLALLWAICVATGRPLFGRFKCKQGAVVIVAEEDTVKAIRRRIWWLARALGVSAAELRALPIRIAVMRGLRLDDAEQVAVLEAEAKAIGAVLLVIDCLSRVHGADENDRTAMKAITLALSALSARTGAAALVLHHFRKSGDGDDQKRPGQLMRGTGDLHALARAIIGVRKKDGALHLYPESNYAEDLEPFAVKLTIDERDDGKREARFEYLGAADEVSERAKDDEVLRIIAAQSEPQTKGEIVNLVGGKADTVRASIKRLALREPPAIELVRFDHSEGSRMVERDGWRVVGSSL